MGKLTEIFTLIEDRAKKIRNPRGQMRFIEDSISWVKILLQMWTKAKVSAEFDEQTIKLFNKIILMRRERGIENNKGFNEMMQEFSSH
jgi:hypothetical protein